jgi:hypothetical protein
MTSPRTLIRQAFRDRLLLVVGDPPAPITRAATRVHLNLIDPVSGPSEMPAIMIAALSQALAATSQDADGYGDKVKTLTVTVSGVLATEDGLEDALDEFADEIESALERMEDHPSGVIVKSRLTQVDHDIGAADDNGVEYIFGRTTLTFSVEYRTATPLPVDAFQADEILGSWSPEIGPPHVDKYRPISEILSEP